MSAVSNSQLAAAIKTIVLNGDLSTLTKKKVYRQLEEEYSEDFAGRKEFIYDTVKQVAEEAQASESSEEEEEVEITPTPRKRKIVKRKPTKKRKSPKRKKKRKRAAVPGLITGIMKPVKISEDLQEFMGCEMAARTEITKKLCAHIREHPELKDPANGRNILAHKSDVLKNLFPDSPEFTYFQMAKLLGPHILTLKKPKIAVDPDAPKVPKGIKAPMKLAPVLAELMGDTILPRTEVVKRLWQHIKSNNLQDPADKREIMCDAAFKTVFKVEKMNMFTMTKRLNEFLEKIPYPEATASAPAEQSVDSPDVNDADNEETSEKPDLHDESENSEPEHSEHEIPMQNGEKTVETDESAMETEHENQQPENQRSPENKDPNAMADETPVKILKEDSAESQPPTPIV